MEIADVPELRPVPLLEGEENFAEWNNLLLKTFQHHGVVDGILLTSATKRPGDVNQEHEGAIWDFIWDKVSNAVSDELERRELSTVYGGLYDGVLVLMAKPSSATPVGDILRDFALLDAKDYRMLRDFQAKIQVTRNQLIRAKCDVGDKVAMWFVLNGLKARYPTWHRSLVRQLEADKLTWPSLMVEIASEAYYAAYCEQPGSHSVDDGSDVVEVKVVKDEQPENAPGEAGLDQAAGGNARRSKRARKE